MIPVDAGIDVTDPEFDASRIAVSGEVQHLFTWHGPHLPPPTIAAAARKLTIDIIPSETSTLTMATRAHQDGTEKKARSRVHWPPLHEQQRAVLLSEYNGQRI